MGDYLRAAFLVLSEAEEALGPKEIVAEALRRGFLETEGLTPHQTMKSKLSTDILEKGPDSLFMRSEAGKFTLRARVGQVQEHVAPRFKKALFDEDIVVFKSELLGRYVRGTGLTSEGLNTKELLAETFPMRRREAEEDFQVIQLVSFYIVTYKKRYLTYKRTKRLPESRLHGFYSIGFGGHLNPDDIPVLFNFADPSQALMFILRELQEELLLDENPDLRFRGLIYDDSREVSRQHLGLVYDVSLRSENFRIGERGFLMDAKFETLEQIRGRIGEFENWSAKLVLEGALEK